MSPPVLSILHLVHTHTHTNELEIEWMNEASLVLFEHLEQQCRRSRKEIRCLPPTLLADSCATTHLMTDDRTKKWNKNYLNFLYAIGWFITWHKSHIINKFCRAFASQLVRFPFFIHSLSPPLSLFLSLPLSISRSDCAKSNRVCAGDIVNQRNLT